MMGQQGSRKDQLFYAFNLEEHVPRTHLLRAIGRGGRTIDAAGWHARKPTFAQLPRFSGAAKGAKQPHPSLRRPRGIASDAKASSNQ
jgi:hypothetical protein